MSQKIKFNRFERVAGLFVLGAMGLFAISFVGVAVKQNWFDRKVQYSIVFKAADGLHAGSVVQMAGLRAGEVDDVELLPDSRIHVRVSMLSKFAEKIKDDSVAQLIRPFVIGERVVDISVGRIDGEPLIANSELKSHETTDLMSLLAGRNLSESLEMMSSMVGNLKGLAEAFLNKERTDSMIRIFDQIDPLVKHLNVMSLEVIKLSRQATKDENMGKVLSQLSVTTRELNALIPVMNAKAPKMGQDIEKLVANLAILTDEFKVFIPALAEIGPDLPHASRRAVQALDEAVVLLKAMQKNIFLRGSVQDIREEESQRPIERLPASRKD